MQYRSMGELRTVARLARVDRPVMSRRDRLNRWAMLLEQQRDRQLTPLTEIERVPYPTRLELEAEGSALAVAYADPVLREEGLVGKKLGDAMRFFALSTIDAHYLLCSCYQHETMTAAAVATRIRAIASRVTFRDLWNRVRRALS
ncbi:MAG TPA: hypothetical protein VFA23_02680 [Dongiaceae bacterium]|nr:hypothetical protein [Dongiaceae bacterium]